MDETNRSKSELIKEVKELRETVKKLQSDQKELMLFKAMAEHLDDSIITTTLDYKINYSNISTQQMYGYSNEELLGQSPDILNANTDSEKMQNEIYETVASGRLWQGEFNNRRKDGSTFPCKITVFPLKDEGGNTFGYVGIQRDVTDQQKIQKALLESEARFRAIFDETFQFIGLLDTDGILLEANRTALDFYKISESQVIGKPFWEAPWWSHSTELQKTLRKAIKKAARGGFARFEASHPAPDGILHHVDVSIKPLKDRDGNIYMLIPEGRDITQRKQLEKERENYIKTLNEKNIDLESIINVISHDLNAPLINGRGFGDILIQRFEELTGLINSHKPLAEIRPALDNLLTGDIPESLGFVTKSLDKIATLLASLVTLARLGKSVTFFEKLEMNKVIDDIKQTMAFKLHSLDITLKTDDLPACLGDKVQITSVFTNLINNSIKYRSPDTDCIIKISGYTEDEHSVFCVEDNGIGIAQEYHDRIFDLFYRVGSHRDVTGEGMGLTIIKRILSRHNGGIWLQSEPQKGSKFFISLPKT